MLLTLLCSFVSTIHLLVGVAYCLVSWAVGLPKRAVSAFTPSLPHCLTPSLPHCLTASLPHSSHDVFALGMDMTTVAHG